MSEVEVSPDRLEPVTQLCRQHQWLTAQERVGELSVAGVGNMNRTWRAHIHNTTGGETIRRTLILKQSVPFVAKYPDIAAPIDRISVEASFYQAVSTDANLSMRMPRMIGFDRANHLAAIADLGASGSFEDLYNSPDTSNSPEVSAPSEISEISDRNRLQPLTGLIYWLWKLHALPVDKLPQDLEVLKGNTDMRRLNHEHIFALPLAGQEGIAPEPLAESAATFSADQALVDAAAALGDIYLGKAAFASRPALLHGDFYPGSFLHDARMGAMIIDPEFAFVGPGEFDLGVLLAHLTFAGLNQADVMGQLRSYVPPPGFDYGLTLKFAGMEVIRRLLGVAQLPLTASTEQRVQWLNQARTMVVDS